MTSDVQGITLAEWAPTTGRSETYIRNFWRPMPGFPSPRRRRAQTGPGPGPEEFDRAALDRFFADLEATRARPARPYSVPHGPDADERLTLGAIAARLGVDGRTISQYREAIEEHVTPEIRGKRRFYPFGQTVTALNDMRRGPGMARDPGHDRRRKDAAQTDSDESD